MPWASGDLGVGNAFSWATERRTLKPPAGQKGDLQALPAVGNLEGLRRLDSGDNDGFGGFFPRYGDPSKAHRALVDATINKADEAPILWRSWAMSEQSQVVAKGVSCGF